MIRFKPSFRPSKNRNWIKFLSFWSALFIIIGICVLAFTIDGPVYAQSDINDFRISSYDIELKLGIDEDKRSTLDTVETIKANFVNEFQNHGIIREIPSVYDGHSTSLDIDSVTDENGNKIDYEITYWNNIGKLKIGNADEYVTGLKTYIITYKQRDVTKAFLDTTEVDEFYWDTNGTGWKVPIDKLSVSLEIDNSIAGSLSGGSSCYLGAEGSTNKCELEASGYKFTTSAKNLNPGENITLAIGFNSGTFAGYQKTLVDKYREFFKAYDIFFVIGCLLLSMWIWYRYGYHRFRSSDIGTIVNEFTPPKDISVSAVDGFYPSPKRRYTAQLLDLAVRGYIKIIETKPKRSVFQPSEHDIEIVKDISNLLPEEKEVIEDLFFDSGKAVGARISLQKIASLQGYITRRLDDYKNLNALLDTKYKLRDRSLSIPMGIISIGIIMIAIGFSVPNIFFVFMGILVISLGFKPFVLTDRGIELMRYLLGLRRYMLTAEKDRVNLLQSPLGADRIPTNLDVLDSAQLLQLNEKLLPYAVIFGMENRWIKELSVEYERIDSIPTWYSGSADAVSMTAITSSLSNFTSSMNMFSVGGSSGGGSSGGGGGGGGGGGW